MSQPRYTSGVDLQPPTESDLSRVDHRVILERVPWAQYESLVKWRGEKAVPRLSFDGERLEIMSPSRHHERLAARLPRLVEVYALHHGILFDTTGSWTLMSKPNVGAEPDASFLFRDDPDATRPDLVIEVNWTRGGVDKLRIYQALAVREVWFWEGGEIRIFALRDGEYEETSSSQFVPRLDFDQLIRHLDARTTSEAMNAYRTELEG